MTEHLWIDTPVALDDFARTLPGAAWIALDTEGDSMYRYRERVCLVQINAGGRIAVIDPLALEPTRTQWPSPALDAIKAVLEDPAVPLWLHGGENDVAVLARDYGIHLRGVWDTQQAAALLGRAQTGYGALVREELGIELDKSWSTYDWATRPLDPRALAYCLADVVHLPDLVERLRPAIAAADVVEEHAIACAAVAASVSHGGAFDPAGFWKIKGAHDLHAQQQGVLCALWLWRDGVARELNQPAGRVVNGDLLLALARSMPTSYQQMKAIGAHGRTMSAHGSALIEVIRNARQTPPTVPPRVRAREVDPVEEWREERLKEWRRRESEQRKVPLQVVLPAKSLEHLKRHGAGDLAAVPQLGDKRRARYGLALSQCCAAGEADAVAHEGPPRRRSRR